MEKDPVPIDTKDFCFEPSTYLNDTELLEDLKKMTTAAEMKDYLQSRYKIRKHFSFLPNKSIKTPVASGTWQCITPGLEILKSHPDVAAVVEKASRGKSLESSEAALLLVKGPALGLPLSTACMQKPPPGSIFLFNRSQVPRFKRDGYVYKKESSGKLRGGKNLTLKVCYAGCIEEDVQRRTYYNLEDEEIALVVYVTNDDDLVDDTLIANPIQNENVEIQNVETADLSMTLATMIAIGIKCKVPGASMEQCCTLANKAHPEDRLTQSTLRKVWNATVETWEQLMDVHPQASTIEEAVHEAVKKAQILGRFETARTDDKTSMAMALSVLSKLPGIPSESLVLMTNLVSYVFSAAPLEWTVFYYGLIKDAVMSTILEDQPVHMVVVWLQSALAHKPTIQSPAPTVIGQNPLLEFLTNQRQR